MWRDDGSLSMSFGENSRRPSALSRGGPSSLTPRFRYGFAFVLDMMRSNRSIVAGVREPEIKATRQKVKKMKKVKKAREGEEDKVSGYKCKTPRRERRGPKRLKMKSPPRAGGVESACTYCRISSHQ